MRPQPEVPQPETVVMDSIRAILERRGSTTPVALDSDLYDDLDMDSLELAELSAVLEDDLGSDPYTAGIVPRTVGEVVAFYGER